MYSLILLALVAFVFALLLTPLVRNTAHRWNLVDAPDARKVHSQPIPRVGGVAIAVSYLLSYLVLLAIGLSGSGIVRDALPLSLKLAPAALIIFATGLLDDIIGLRPWQKLAGQFAASLAACLAGVLIQGVGGHILSPWMAAPLTVLWLLACTNALNLIDGIDGLAAGVGLFAAVTSLIAALLQGNLALAFATVPLAGALLGFLRFNFNPATIFLGDSGSLLIGFLLGCFGVLWSEKSATILGMTAPLIALAIPLLDTTLAIARRFLRQQPIFGADRAHIHHKLLSRGFTPRRVALMLYGVCGLAAAASLLLTVTARQFHGFVIILVCLATWLGVQHLGYVEFGTARKLVLGGAFRGLLNAQITLTSFEHDLLAAQSVDEMWEVLRRNYAEFGFGAITMEADGRWFNDVTDDSPRGQTWQIHLVFPGGEYVSLTRTSGPAARTSIAVPFADSVQRILGEKLDRIPHFPQAAFAATMGSIQ
jgi:UDP-GlcNAc:undecaprenyl-phosphate GlcNAc-1-phosphate transferase